MQSNLTGNFTLNRRAFYLPHVHIFMYHTALVNKFNLCGLPLGIEHYTKIGGKAPMHVCYILNRDMARSICWDKISLDLKFVD
jgi:hypothetical protein